MPILLSNSQAGPGRTVKQEQEEISRNHVQTFIYLSVVVCLVTRARTGPNPFTIPSRSSKWVGAGAVSVSVSLSLPFPKTEGEF